MISKRYHIQVKLLLTMKKKILVQQVMISQKKKTQLNSFGII